MRLILDITRTFLRRGNATPTGIDRVEFAFLSCLFDHPDYADLHFIVTTHVGCGVVPKATVRKLLREVSTKWTPHMDDRTHLRFERLLSDLRRPVDPSRRAVARYGGNQGDAWSAAEHAKLVPLALLGAARLHRLRLDASKMPTFYLHVSHVCLEHPIIFRWADRSHIKPVFFVHDIIPIDYPEYCPDNAYRNHVRRIKTASSIGQAIVVNSSYTKERLDCFLAEANFPSVPIVVSKLGTEVLASHNIEAIDPAVPYFVHVGTIEARKNVTHLLNVWRRLIARDGPNQTPRLVLAGRRGWRSQSVFDVLDRGRELAPYVSEVSDLNDAELATLVRSSTGVLAPSFVEGFGLPGAEALAQGVPVVASDIPAHREILEDAAVFLDPIDGVGWAETIRSLAWSNAFRQDRVDAARRFKPLSWNEHVDTALSRAFDEIANRLR